MPNKQKLPSQRLSATLVTLVAAMTAGTLLLQWFHNGAAGSAAAARSLIARPPPDARPWHGIVIHPTRGGAQARPFHHFYIDELGSESFTAAWEQGQTDADGSANVHILVARSAETRGVTPRQWEALVARVRTLQARNDILLRSIAVDIAGPTQDGSLRGDAEQLRRMLRAAGVSG